MESSQEGKRVNKVNSIVTLVSVEGGIVFVLVILILFTFNYFNIIPLSKFLTFLPHQTQEEKTPTPNRIRTKYVKPDGMASCPGIPNNSQLPKISQPQSSVSASLNRFLGIWEGNWNEHLSAGLVIATINSNIAGGQYYYARRLSPGGSLYDVVGNKLVSKTGNLTWEIVEGKMIGTFEVGSKSATVIMRKCLQ